MTQPQPVAYPFMVMHEPPLVALVVSPGDEELEAAIAAQGNAFPNPRFVGSWDARLLVHPETGHRLRTAIFHLTDREGTIERHWEWVDFPTQLLDLVETGPHVVGVLPIGPPPHVVAGAAPTPTDFLPHPPKSLVVGVEGGAAGGDALRQVAVA